MIARCVAAPPTPDRRRKAVHELIVPLVEDGDSPIAVGNAVSVKVPSASHLVKAKSAPSGSPKLT